MDGGRQFYVTLPSNSSKLYYPDNTLSDFTTKLLKPISLPARWEVGLCEISFPHSFYNVVSPINQILYSGDGSRQNVKLLTIPEGYYSDLDQLFVIIHELMDDLGKANIKLRQHKNTQKVKVKLLNGAFIDIHPGLREILGLMGDSNRISKSTESLLPADVNTAFNSLYVYTNISEPVPVGDVEVQLLRIVHMNSTKCGENIVQTYQFPHFVGLKLNHFDTIDIHLRNATGSKISFQRGRVTVKLAFRPARGPYI